MKIAMAQINATIADFTGNRVKILEQTRLAHQAESDLIVFPELALCGYPPMDLLDHESFTERNRESLDWLQRQSPKDIGVLVGWVDRNPHGSGKPLMNAASLIHNGRIIHTQYKTLLPTYDVFDEARYFEPAKERKVFDFLGKRVGIAICEDIWWEEGMGFNPMDDLLLQKPELIITPSASPFHLNKIKKREELVKKLALSAQAPVVYVNMLGGNDSLIFDGQSMVSSAQGQLISLAKPFAQDLVFCDPYLQHHSVTLSHNPAAQMEGALVLGIKDYLAKCGFKRAHLGLSGGIDSAVVAVLAVKALGPDNVKVFALPSRYSSPESSSHAQKLADNLGITLTSLSIENIFSQTLKDLAPLFQGHEPDITEENLQARIRGILLMAYSNKFRSLLLATGNKSELATGYCTLYGDMCGGLSVIGDLFKTDVYELSHYINRHKVIIPWEIIRKPPSAELRYDQRDEDSLPSYKILDQILRLYLLENQDAEKIIGAGFDPEEVHHAIKLTNIAEYKRRQAAPVLKISTKAFGTGRRIPIARKF